MRLSENGDIPDWKLTDQGRLERRGTLDVGDAKVVDLREKRLHLGFIDIMPNMWPNLGIA